MRNKENVLSKGHLGMLQGIVVPVLPVIMHCVTLPTSPFCSMSSSVKWVDGSEEFRDPFCLRD